MIVACQWNTAREKRGECGLERTLDTRWVSAIINEQRRLLILPSTRGTVGDADGSMTLGAVSYSGTRLLLPERSVTSTP